MRCTCSQNFKDITVFLKFKNFYKYLILLYFIILPFKSNAVSLVHLAAPDIQLSNSEGVIQGYFKELSFRRTIQGDVVTDLLFTKVKLAGIRQENFINIDDFKVTYMGGIWQGVSYSSRMPHKFKAGHEYVLLIKKTEIGYSFSNPLFGVFEVKEFNQEKILNSMHPFKDLAEIQLSYSRFNFLVNKYFGEELVSNKLGLDPTLTTSDNVQIGKRQPASGDDEVKPSLNLFALLWPVIVLGSFGFLGTMIRKYL